MLPELDAALKTPWGDFLQQRLAAFPEKTNPLLVSRPGGVRTAIAYVAKDSAGFKALSQARKLIEPLLDSASAASNMAEALVAAAHAALFQLPRITEKAAEPLPLQALNFYGAFGTPDFDKDIGWVHVDMASSGTHKGGLAHIPTDLQEFFVRRCGHTVLSSLPRRLFMQKIAYAFVMQ